MNRIFAEEESHEVCKVCDHAIKNEECPGCGFSFASFSIRERDAEIRRQTIEKCAEIMSNHMRCFDCPLDCNESDIDSCAESLRLFLDNLMKGETE